jgi:gamma-glutamyltranspeptidase/glutathione hydrolase
MQISPAALLEPAFLSTCAQQIRRDHAGHPHWTLPRDYGTVYLTAADEHGMMVSFIQSNFRGFGSGIVIPGTGIAMQNRASGFVLEAGHPNQVAGGKRPYHTIIPGFVTRDGQPLMSFGVMGGHMQPQGHVQMLVRMCDYAQNPQTALDAPRWHVTEDFHLLLEEGIAPHVREELAQRGHHIAVAPHRGVFGGGQLIYRLADGYCAASDPRKDGMAMGY